MIARSSCHLIVQQTRAREPNEQRRLCEELLAVFVQGEPLLGVEGPVEADEVDVAVAVERSHQGPRVRCAQIQSAAKPSASEGQSRPGGTAALIAMTARRRPRFR